MGNTGIFIEFHVITISEKALNYIFPQKRKQSTGVALESTGDANTWLA